MIDSINIEDFRNAVIDTEQITGFTHDFYNYPARFSPRFAREAIKSFTEPGDLIIDPFMGGGTTLVEANLLGRNSVGFDISSLAYFITNVKTTILNDYEKKLIIELTTKILHKLNCHVNFQRPTKWINKGYLKNLSTPKTWPIRKLIEQSLIIIESSNRPLKIKNYIRCGILKVGQWALDSTKKIPSTNQFKEKLIDTINQMIAGSTQYSNHASKYENLKTIAFNSPSTTITRKSSIKQFNPPKLILTSPPYPGVHILYHRWQINGRKETPAPFWIANQLDGHGLSHYTMGGRHETGINNYFNGIERTFNSIRKVCNNDTLIVQMLAFNNPEDHLPKYISSMQRAGFKETMLEGTRIWRNVPNRKWYTNNNPNIKCSREVVLFHRLIN